MYVCILLKIRNFLFSLSSHPEAGKVKSLRRQQAINKLSLKLANSIHFRSFVEVRISVRCQTAAFDSESGTKLVDRAVAPVSEIPFHHYALVHVRPRKGAIPFHIPLFFSFPLFFPSIAVITLAASVSRERLRLTRPCLACESLPDARLICDFCIPVTSQYLPTITYNENSLACLTNR